MDGRLAALTEHYCDFGDLLPIARVLRERIDWVRLDREYRDIPLADAFLYLLERLDIIEPRVRLREGAGERGRERNGDRAEAPGKEPRP
jgi:hypothetical protein